MIIAIFLVVFSMVFQFIGPSVLLKLILEYLEDPTLEVKVGVTLVVLLFFNQFLRNISYNLQQSIGIHTGEKRRKEVKKHGPNIASIKAQSFPWQLSD